MSYDAYIYECTTYTDTLARLDRLLVCPLSEQQPFSNQEGEVSGIWPLTWYFSIAAVSVERVRATATVHVRWRMPWGRSLKAAIRLCAHLSHTNGYADIP
ncbi:hypothetical protein [Methylobacterium sp. SI9]|uniref:hypothetical protein n=1 Tax=Methylobacterium guangdongense TaxID=3138811 RepID=UPI00313EBBDE